MKRIKVINDATDFACLFRVVDTPVKKEVLREVTEAWRSEEEIREKYGEEGVKALQFFEKMRIVETRWQVSSGGRTGKVYRTFYSSFHINTSCPITDIGDILTVAMMDDKEFEKHEKKVYDLVGDKGMFVGDVAETLNINNTFLRSIVKRSTKLEQRGHRICRVRD